MEPTFMMMMGYGAGFVVALYMTVWWRQFRARRVWRAGSTMQISKVSAYQMALMSGGASRVALTGVVRLLGSKVLVPGIAGVLTQSSEFHDGLDTVELEGVALARKPFLFKDFLVRLEMQLKSKGLIRELRGELVAVGYMRARGSWNWWSNYLRNMLPFVVLLGASLYGVAKVAGAVGAQIELLQFSILTAVTMLIVALPTRVTALGRYIVWSAKQHHPDFKTARAVQGEAIDIKTLGQSVALYGQDALAGSDMAWIPAVMAHVENSD
jgi:uncharacterized protein (TIGR04222 family)